MSVSEGEGESEGEGDGLAWYVLKLRRNIALEGDLALARMELEALCGTTVHDAPELATLAERWPALATVRGLAALGACCRAQGQQGYVLLAPMSLLPTLITRASFLQAIYCLPERASEGERLAGRLSETVGPVARLVRATEATEATEAGAGPVVYAVPHYLLMELSAVVARGSRTAEDVRRALPALLDTLLDTLLGNGGDAQVSALARAALDARSTTSHLAHDLHYYKAKFFPRMARALVNVCAERAGGDTHAVLDTFAGSGTALLESAVLGIPSVGVDLDPLSVLIARAKLDTLRFSSGMLEEEARRFPRTSREDARGGVAETERLDGYPPVAFPAWLLRNRKMTERLAEELAEEIGTVRRGVEATPPELRDLMRVLFSDAIARKVRLRFLGTGVGRFSLTVRKTPLEEAVGRGIARCARAAAAREWLEGTLRLRPAAARALVADARRLPPEVGTFDVLVTSPPYLPASSGRESYTKGRAPSLIALGLSDAVAVDDLVDGAVGSMDGGGADEAELTAEEAELVAWLRGDELRAIKAAPTARYFLDMRRAFAEMHRVQTPGARAAVVSGKMSTFYQFASREALYVAPVAEMLAVEAERAGFVVEGMHDIQLAKANRNARPRALDAYYETLIVLRRT